MRKVGDARKWMFLTVAGIAIVSETTLVNVLMTTSAVLFQAEKPSLPRQ